MRLTANKIIFELVLCYIIVNLAMIALILLTLILLFMFANEFVIEKIDADD